MTDVWTKKVHGFPVRTPICHIVPISRIYEGGSVFIENLRRGGSPGEGGWGPSDREGVCLEIGGGGKNVFQG